MSELFDDTMQGLLEALEIQKGAIPLTEKKEMCAKTFYVSDNDTALINRIVEIRKEENISQTELARMIGSKQQTISQLEQNKHSPSLKLFYCIADALGYEVRLVKK